MTDFDHRHIHHDWHTLDELRGYEARRDGDVITIRTPHEREIELNAVEFNELRGTGPKPGGLE
jgi:hypothetical protein